MKQILQSYKTGELWLAEVPVPVCKSGGVVIQTRNSFVSAGTERMLVDFARKNIIGKAVAMPDQVKKVLRKMKTEGILSTLEKVQTKLDQPIPLGYSCAGIVEEVGRHIAELSGGDRVACAGAGYANHSDYNYVPKNLAVKIPDSVSFEDASCATVGSIALQGIRQCDLRLGETVCVMGLGLLGILAVQMLKASGVRVVGFDPDEGRCKLARDLGADMVVSSDLEAACNGFSQGYGVDAVLITAATKSNEPVTIAGEICRIKGKVVVTGLVGMDVPRDMYYKKELDFKLSLSYGPGRYDTDYEEGGHDYPFGYVRWTEQRNIKAFMDLVESGAVTPSRLVTHRFAMDDALDAYQLILGKTKEPYLGIVLNYDEKPGGITRELRRTQIRQMVKGVSEINIGFIGAGNFTKAVLFPSLKKQKDICLKTICTATGMNAGQTAEKEGFASATTDYKELLNDPDINIVFVTTQHNSHARFVKAAIKAGKHVFVEKPLCINREELNELQSVYDSSNQHVLVGFNRRFSPHAKLIRDYFQDRRTPMMVNYRVNAGIIPPDVWIQKPDVGGGRIIGEVCHFIDFASFIIGSRPVEVQAMCVATSNAKLVEQDNVTISIKYGDGSVAQIFYVAVGAEALSKEYCEVFADESVAVMDNFCSTVCMGKRGKKKLKGKQEKGFTQEITAFLTAVREGGKTPIEFQSIVDTTLCTFAVLESLRTRRSVNLIGV
jgi:predicted dehydrogenase/threonine dehydrogenase-like Zn-dependent dehydrogenase